jgi:NAD kinase
MGVVARRAVFVTRETDLESLLARHGTREQARFYLETRGQDIGEVERRHDHFAAALHEARSGAPGDWRQVLVKRADFDRFLFAPEDVIVAVGQDGLVANVAKYLRGQPVIGVNPDPELFDGILARWPAGRLGSALRAAAAGNAAIQQRTMVEARLDGGERLLALNEIFVGHRSHQSARYEIAIGGMREYQSSSGLIAATGTGATGWARSIMGATGWQVPLAPDDRAFGYFVREPFPSVVTGTSVRSGRVEAAASIEIVSRLNEGGAIFADGIEKDFLAFDWGRRVELRVAEERLNLVVG